MELAGSILFGMPEDLILARLEREEWEAHQALTDACQKFNQVIKEMPSGMPHPDGSLRIQQAGAELRRCNRLHNEASGRLMDHLMRKLSFRGTPE